MAKYLDNDGLLYFWQKIKNTFAKASDVPGASGTSPKMDGSAAVGTETAWAHGDHVHPTDTSRAPVAHASTATTYGVGTGSNYGHVKLSDSTSSTSAASAGVAASPKAVKDALDAAKSYADSNDANTTYTLTQDATDGHKVTLTPSSGTAQTITIPDSDTTYPEATNSTGGIMTDAQAAKLAGIAAGANAYTHPAYTAAAAAAVKVGRDASGHVVVGDALTASDVGASASGHKHAAGDITSGTLGVARGGTGASTLGAGVVYHSASGTGALSIASAANLVSALGTTAVNRATADAAGNSIADTYARKDELANMYEYKGSVATAADLPSTGQSVGDVYNIEAASAYGGAGANVAWNGTAWDALGEVFSISSITNGEIDTIVAS